MAAQDVLNLESEVRTRALFVLLLVIFLSAILGTMLSGGITHPVKKLVSYLYSRGSGFV